jgi:hypothetical protein
VSWRQYDAQTILLHEGAGSVLSTKQHCWSIPPHIIDKREKIGGCVGSNAWYGTPKYKQGCLIYSENAIISIGIYYTIKSK